jgi:hypothetical protein
MSECNVCVGLRYYPIIDRYGTELYSISCPECMGTGTVQEEVSSAPAEAEDLPPASTAASIFSMDDMRLHVAKHWSAP